MNLKVEQRSDSHSRKVPICREINQELEIKSREKEQLWEFFCFCVKLKRWAGWWD